MKMLVLVLITCAPRPSPFVESLPAFPEETAAEERARLDRPTNWVQTRPSPFDGGGWNKTTCRNMRIETNAVVEGATAAGKFNHSGYVEWRCVR